MLVKNLICGAILACTVLALAGGSVFADGKQEQPGLSGVWQQKDGMLKIEFVDKDTIKIYPHGDAKLVSIQCEYTSEKKDVVKLKITEIAGEAKEKVEKLVPVGLEFSFQWTSKDNAGKLENVKGQQIDILKSHLEGKYDLKK